ncbi:P-loop NTPase [Myxococcota bacterium]|nr:P-loop NTPase [Myxococcota bacterium]
MSNGRIIGLKALQGGLSSSSNVVQVPARHRFLSISGGKGGVGKSTVALNLAVTYAKTTKTVILDGDLGMADLNLLLGLAPTKSMLDLLDGTKLDDVLVEAHGLSLLPALNGSHRLANLGDEARAFIVERIAQLRETFDTVVIDIPAGIGIDAMTLASRATDPIVVATPEPLSLADAYACIKVLATRHGVKRVMLVPNSVHSERQANEIFMQLSSLVDRFLGIELVQLPAVPYDPSIPHAAASGTPLVIARPDSLAARAIQKVARAIETAASSPRG